MSIGSISGRGMAVVAQVRLRAAVRLRHPGARTAQRSRGARHLVPRRVAAAGRPGRLAGRGPSSAPARARHALSTVNLGGASRPATCADARLEAYRKAIPRPAPAPGNAIPETIVDRGAAGQLAVIEAEVVLMRGAIGRRLRWVYLTRQIPGWSRPSTFDPLSIRTTGIHSPRARCSIEDVGAPTPAADPSRRGNLTVDVTRLSLAQRLSARCRHT